MNVEEKLYAILTAIQQDPGNRGLGRDPQANLFNACPGDFARACRGLAEHPAPVLGVVTGFWIPSAKLGETDGPLGAVYLARTLPGIGVRVALVSDPFCTPALTAGLKKCESQTKVPVAELPVSVAAPSRLCSPEPTHWLALERVGPSHTLDSIRVQAGADEETVQRFVAEVSPTEHGRCRTMRGVDITPEMRDAAILFDRAGGSKHPITIGIGDGGNEIGMGKISWDVIRRNIPRGGLIACRVATDYLIVAGVSNWGAYALAAGVALLRGVEPPAEWFDVERERGILTEMVEQGPLVDGVKGQPAVSVDGLEFDTYIEPLRRIAAIMRA